MSYETMSVDEFRLEFGAKGHKPQVRNPYRGEPQAKRSGLIEIELPLPPKALHPNSRPSWQAKAAAVKKARRDCCFVGQLQRPAEPLAKATLQATFYLRRRQDDDNLAGWLKAYRDGLQDACIVADDADLTMLPVVQVIDKQPRVVLRIEKV